MRAYKCDRCGALYETFNGSELVDKYKNQIAPMQYKNGNWQYIDLCDECMGLFLDFMNNGGNEECQ